MKTYSKTDDRRCGSGMITVMIVVATISTCLGIIAFSSVQRGHMAVMMGHRIRALSIAEAGANRAYSLIKTNWPARVSATFPLAANYGDAPYDGSYIAHVRVPNFTTTVVSITCTGVCRTATAAVALDVKNYGPPSWKCDFAILCGGTFDFGGCGTITSTNQTVTMHSNSAITISGSANVGGDGAKLDIESSTSILIKNNKDVEGDVTAPVITGGGTADSKTTNAVPTVTVPQIDLSYYYTLALMNNQVMSAGWTPPYTPYTPPGGIIWVAGDTGTINGGQINGAVIAAGSVKLSGTVNITADQSIPPGFAVVSNSGDIDNQSSGTIQGIIYAKTGNYTQTANGTLIGSLVVAGTISKGGVSDAVVYDNSGATNGYDDVGVSAWKQ